MRYYLTQFSVQSYPFVSGRFEESLNEHLVTNYDRNREVVQVWHTCQTRSDARDFDYFNVLWKSIPK